MSSTSRRKRPRPVFSMRMGASRSSRRRFSRMSRLSKLSLKSGRSSVGSSRTSRLVKSTRPSWSYWREQRPQDPAGHALDEVVAVEEGAAVDREEADVGGPGRRGSHPIRALDAGRVASAIRSSARIVSIALAEQRGDDAERAPRRPAVGLGDCSSRPRARRPPARARRRAPPSGCPPRPAPARGISWPGPMSPDSSNERRTDPCVLRHLPEAPDPTALARLGRHADHALARARPRSRRPRPRSRGWRS